MNRPQPTATRKDRRTLYQGRIFTLDVERVLMPSGHEVEMELVRHPGSVVLLPMPTPASVILVWQYRYAIERWVWELPAGTVKPGEDPAVAAARECEEEVGLVPQGVERLFALYPTPGFCDEIMQFYRCTGLRPPAADSAVRKDEDEDLEPRAFTLDAARGMIASGEIVDMKTVAALLRI